MQLTQAIPGKWKQILKKNLDISQNSIYLNHHLIKNKLLVSLEKLDSKDISNIIISNIKKRTNIPKLL